jgi:hypothetical protein
LLTSITSSTTSISKLDKSSPREASNFLSSSTDKVPFPSASKDSNYLLSFFACLSLSFGCFLSSPP